MLDHVTRLHFSKTLGFIVDFSINIVFCRNISNSKVNRWTSNFCFLYVYVDVPLGAFNFSEQLFNLAVGPWEGVSEGRGEERHLREIWGEWPWDWWRTWLGLLPDNSQTVASFRRSEGRPTPPAPPCRWLFPLGERRGKINSVLEIKVGAVNDVSCGPLRLLTELKVLLGEDGGPYLHILCQGQTC